MDNVLDIFVNWIFKADANIRFKLNVQQYCRAQKTIFVIETNFKSIKCVLIKIENKIFSYKKCIEIYEKCMGKYFDLNFPVWRHYSI